MTTTAQSIPQSLDVMLSDGAPKPTSPTPEEMLLGTVILYPETLDDVTKRVRATDFHQEQTAAIFQAMLQLRGRGDPLEIGSLTAFLEENGQREAAAGLADLVERVGQLPHSPVTPIYSADRLRNLSGGHGKVVEVKIPDQRTPDTLGSGLVTTSLDQVKTEKVEWLYKPYLPLGKIILVEGDPGIGKTCITEDFCSQATKQGKPVLFATAEDGLGDTIKPRAEAMGANLEIFHILQGVAGKDHQVLPFDLDSIQKLEATIAKIRPVILVLDPIQAFIGSSTDMHRPNAVRARLAPLARLAEKYGIAIILIRHLTKGTADKSMYRGQGSIDFSAAARSILLVGKTTEGQRAMVQIKNSLAECGAAQGFEIDDEGFRWKGEVNLTAGDLLAPEERSAGSTLEDAKNWLESRLAAGPVAAEVVEKESRFSISTLRRAKKELGVLAKPVRDTDGVMKKWRWFLPDNHPDAQKDNSTEQHIDHLDKNMSTMRVSSRCSRAPGMINWIEPSNGAGLEAFSPDAHLGVQEDEHLDEHLVTCRACANAEKGKDWAMCQVTPWNGSRGQVPDHPHLCSNFSRGEANGAH